MVLLLPSCLRTASAMRTSLSTSGEAPPGASDPAAGPNRGASAKITSVGDWTTFIRMVAS